MHSSSPNLVLVLWLVLYQIKKFLDWLLLREQLFRQLVFIPSPWGQSAPCFHLNIGPRASRLDWSNSWLGLSISSGRLLLHWAHRPFLSLEWGWGQNLLFKRKKGISLTRATAGKEKSLIFSCLKEIHSGSGNTFEPTSFFLRSISHTFWIVYLLARLTGTIGAFFPAFFTGYWKDTISSLTFSGVRNSRSK